MPRALLSVYDKTGLVEFASSLLDLGWDLVASGGTEQVLRSAGLAVVGVEQLTGLPHILGGRVKTLHPAVHAGILARDNSDDLGSLGRLGYAPIDMVVCNLYPFQETVARKDVPLQDALEQIDIGGVALLRAAAKNFLRVVCVCDVNDYTKIIAELKATGSLELVTRRQLAIKAFAHTRDYDTAVHAFLSQDSVQGFALPVTSLPQQLSIGMQQVEPLRYGENPHQLAAYYSRLAKTGPLGGTLLSGKELSYNNMLDLDAAWRAVSAFSEPTVVIVKHLNPTGIASAATIAQAFPQALESDSVSAFGGVLAVNRPVDDDFAACLGSLFIEAIAAPSYTPTAVTTLASERRNCRLVQLPHFYSGSELEIRSVIGGFLVQTADVGDPDTTTLRVVSERSPTADELDTLRFAWKAVQAVRSNAIVLALPNRTVGIGGGLPSRVDSTRLAVAKAGDRARGAVLASDAFFPFADSIQVAAQAGVTAIIQPGGSIRDKEVIDAVDQAQLAMIFTGTRHFRH